MRIKRIDIKGTIITDRDKPMYKYFGIDATCPKDVKSVIDNAEGETVDVYINSGGGEIFSATEIYSALREYRNVRIHVVGMAASAASIIMCAADCDISPTSMVMIHNVSSWAVGDHRAMAHESDVLLAATKAMAAAYVVKTGKSEDDFLRLMDEEHWFTAREAVEMGLCDRISGDDSQQLVNAWCTLITSEQKKEYQGEVRKSKMKLKLLEVINNEK